MDRLKIDKISNSMSCIKMQTFFGDGDQQRRVSGNPDLRFDSVTARAKAHLDAQMQLDPLEEQLQLPALALQIGNQHRRTSRIQHQVVHDFNRMGLADGKVNESVEVAPQVHQHVQLNGGLCRAKQYSRKHRQKDQIHHTNH